MIKRKKKGGRDGGDDLRPPYVVRAKIKDRDIGGWANVGTGWDVEGGISIKLGVGVVLDWREFSRFGDFMLCVYPNDKAAK